MESDAFLHRYFLNNGGKRLHKWLHYFDIYERHFERLRAEPITMLEVGVSGGGSLEMWASYFHPESRIVGIDINPDCAQHAKDRIDVHIGSQDDVEFLEGIVDQYGEFDIVLDDGSHINSHIIATFEALFGHVSKNGVYFIEDLHTSYWPKWGGGLKKPGAFMEYAKDRIDELNASHIKGMEPTEITKTTTSITFYDSIVVFEKSPQAVRQHVITQTIA